MPDPAPRISRRTGQAAMLLLVTVGGVLFGSLIGYFFSPMFQTLIRAMFGVELSRWTAGCIIAGLITLNAVGNTLRRMWRSRKAEAAAGQLDMEFSADGGEQLERQLRPMFSENARLSLQNVVHKQIGDAKFAVADMSYRSGSEDSSSRQTVAYFECPGLRLPTFTMSPEGTLISLFTNLVGGNDIDFDDYPEFSKQYLLVSTDEASTRRLFNREVLEYFTESKGLDVRGDGDRLVLFRRHREVSSAKLESFVQQATHVFSLLDAAAAAQPAAPSPRTAATGGVGSVATGGGLVSPSLGALAQRVQVTVEQAKAFINSPVPREIPDNIRRAKLPASTWIAVAFGGVFTVAGLGMLAVGLLMSDTPWSEGERLIPTGMGIVFFLVGSSIALFTVRHLRRTQRLLKSGKAATGTVTEVAGTSVSVNGQRRYRATIVFDVDGVTQQTQCSLYGNSVAIAEEYAASQSPMGILVDPQDSTRILPECSLVNLPFSKPW